MGRYLVRGVEETVYEAEVEAESVEEAKRKFEEMDPEDARQVDEGRRAVYADPV